MSCAKKLQELYRGVLEEDKIKNLAEFVDAELHKGSPRETYMHKIRDIMGDTHAAALSDVMNFVMASKAELEALDNIKKSYKGDYQQGINDMLYEGTSNNPYSGLSVERMKQYYMAKLVHSLDTSLISMGDTVPNLIKDITLEESIKLRNAMSGNKSGIDIIDALAERFIKHNKHLYTEKFNGGLFTRFNKDYGFHRRYDAAKVKDMGLKNFMNLLLDNLDANKTMMNGISPATASALKNVINAKGVTDDYIQNIYRNFRKSTTNDAFKNLMDEMVDLFEEFTTPIKPEDLIFATKYEQKGSLNNRKTRSLYFKNPTSEMTVMGEIGKYGHNIYEYIQADSESVARQMSLISKFGPNPKSTFESLVKKLHLDAMKEGQKFSVADAQAKWGIMTGDVLSPIRELKDATTLDKKFNYLAVRATDVTNAAVLATSMFAQVRDIVPLANQYLLRSNEPIFQRFSVLMSESIGGFKDAWTNNPRLVEFMPTLIEKTFGEIEAQYTLNFHNKALNWMFRNNGVEFLNKVSTSIGLRLAAHHLSLLDKGDSAFKEAARSLAKVGLNPEDMPLLSELITKVDSPMELLNMPVALFEKNHLGISGEAYREQLAKSAYAFMSGYMKNGTPTTQMREFISLGGGTDRTSFGASFSILMSQLKRITTAAVNQHVSLSNATNKFKHKPMNLTYVVASGLAISSTMYMISEYLRASVAEGFDVDKTNARFLNKGNIQQKVFESVARSNALALFTEPVYQMYKAKSTETATSAILPPAMGLLTNAGIVASDIGYNILDKDKQFLSSKGARALVDGVRLTIPGYTILYYLPVLEMKTEIERDMIKWLDNLDGQGTKKRSGGGYRSSL